MQVKHIPWSATVSMVSISCPHPHSPPPQPTLRALGIIYTCRLAFFWHCIVLGICLAQRSQTVWIKGNPFKICCISLVYHWFLCIFWKQCSEWSQRKKLYIIHSYLPPKCTVWFQKLLYTHSLMIRKEIRVMPTSSILITFSVQGRHQEVCHKLSVTVDFSQMSSLILTTCEWRTQNLCEKF